ncbi:MAG: Uma2 family endonuclease [Chloroflexota bacterium]
MVTRKARYTFADLLTMPEANEWIYEILGGELVVFSSPNTAHGAAVMATAGICLEAQQKGFGLVFTAPCAVAFDYAERGLQAQDVTHPDVLFIRAARRSIIGEQCIEGAPDLVVEVLSRSTRSLDLPGGRKFAIYERYGVPFYWVVDLVAQTVAQYTWHEGRYGEAVVLHAGDTLACSLFPGLSWDVDRLFAGIPRGVVGDERADDEGLGGPTLARI